MYAIIEDSGGQIKVSEGDVIFVDLREMPENSKDITFDRVLLVSQEDGKLKIGEPYVSGAKVSAELLKEARGPKLRTVKFRRRKNYRRKLGHRQDLLKIKITKIAA